MHTPADVPTPAPENGKRGLGDAARDVSERAKRLFDLQAELASLELKEKAGALAGGAGIFVGAALLAFFAIGFLFATLAAGLATFLDVWLALLIVTLLLLLLVAILVLVGRAVLRRGTPPIPRQAIEEARLTSDALRSDGAG